MDIENRGIFSQTNSSYLQLAKYVISPCHSILNQGLHIALESNNKQLFSIVFHSRHEKTFKNIGETFQNQIRDSPFPELVVRRNYHSSD